MTEPLVIAAAVILAAFYLVLRAIRKARRKSASTCGGQCACPAAQSATGGESERTSPAKARADRGT